MRQMHERRGKCSERGGFGDERFFSWTVGQLDSWTIEIRNLEHWNYGTKPLDNSIPIAYLYTTNL
jgi:hypothetical protein